MRRHYYAWLFFCLAVCVADYRSLLMVCASKLIVFLILAGLLMFVQSAGMCRAAEAFLQTISVLLFPVVLEEAAHWQPLAQIVLPERFYFSTLFQRPPPSIA